MMLDTGQALRISNIITDVHPESGKDVGSQLVTGCPRINVCKAENDLRIINLYPY